MFGSSQSRIAKMEAAEPSVSIDLMVHCLLRMAASRQEVASYIARGPANSHAILKYP